MGYMGNMGLGYSGDFIIMGIWDSRGNMFFSPVVIKRNNYGFIGIIVLVVV